MAFHFAEELTGPGTCRSSVKVKADANQDHLRPGRSSIVLTDHSPSRNISRNTGTVRRWGLFLETVPTLPRKTEIDKAQRKHRQMPRVVRDDLVTHAEVPGNSPKQPREKDREKAT